MKNHQRIKRPGSDLLLIFIFFAAAAALSGGLCGCDGCGTDEEWTPVDGGDGGDPGEGTDLFPDGMPDGVPDALPDGDVPADTVDEELGSCKITPSPEPFDNPSMDLHWGEGSTDLFPTYINVLHTPVVVDFVEEGPDEDMIPEVVFVSYNQIGPGVLRVFSGRAPHDMIYTIAGTGAPNDPDDTPLLHWDGHPAAGDLDGDGKPEVVVSKYEGGGMIAYKGDGSILWESTEPPQAEIRTNASVAIANIDGAGPPEIVVGRCVLDAGGSLLWCGTEGRGTNRQGPLSCVADLDGDTLMEVVAGRTVYDSDGNAILALPGGGDGADGFCAIADLFNGTVPGSMDGQPEIVRVVESILFIHDSVTGERLDRYDLPGGGRGGAPTVADFDGDTLSEVGVAGATRYSVFDIDTTSVLWSAVTEDDSSNVTASTVFDFNGDGTAEVVYNDEQRFMVFNGPDGTLLFEEWNPSRTRTEEPIVADVDNDGNAEIVFCANTEADFAGDGIPTPGQRIPGLEIWGSGDDTWVSALPVWNQHTFHITNVSVLGVIPTVEEPSWTAHNTYRLNSEGEAALSAPDLVGDAGPVSCVGTTMTICVSVGNLGEIRVGPGIEIAVYVGDPDAGGELVCSALTESNLNPGDWEEVCCDWENASTEPVELFVVVDASDAERECREDNVFSLGEQRCMPIG
jgi:hypothetical protein